MGKEEEKREKEKQRNYLKLQMREFYFLFNLYIEIYDVLIYNL